MAKCNKLPLLLSILLLSSCGGEVTSQNGTSTPEDEVISTELYGKEIVADTTKTEAVYDGSTIEVSKVNKTDKGNNIVVDGKDFLFIGTQIRVDAFLNCDKLSYKEVRVLFEEASKLGVTCVQIPLEWAKIEVQEDQFDYTYISQMLQFANEFNLKIEFLWYGTNMCGDSHSYTVPNYILKDGKTYPKFDALRTGEYWNYYGILWFLDFDNENLVAKECNAMNKVMDYIYEYDSTHGGKKPFIGMQVLNEPDIFVRWRTYQQNVISRTTNEIISEEEGYSKICNSLNALGKVVKNSKYKVYTRVNLASSTSGDYNGVSNGIYSGSVVKDAPSFAKRFQALEGIDIVGDDSYTSSIKNIKGIVKMFSTIESNFGHIAENDGNYSNTASLILTSVANHGGYSIYDLLTSPFFVANNSTNIDQGIILYKENSYTQFTYKNHYEETKNIINGLKMISNEVYKVSPEDFIAFNIASDYAKKLASQMIASTNVKVSFETNNAAIGYAVDLGTHLDVFVTADSSISLSNGTISSIQTGTYENDTWSKTTDETISSNIALKANTLYRIEYTSNGKITSTTWDNIGG